MFYLKKIPSIKEINKNNFFHFKFYSEESKPDSDLDEPWIMTVKGINFNNLNKQGAAILAGDESILSTSPYKHNGSNNALTRDSNLNHYKLNQVCFTITHFHAFN